MFRGVIFNRDKLVSDGLELAGRCLKVASRPPSAVLVYDPGFLDHIAWPFHGERPDRLRSIVSHLERADLSTDVERAPPAPPAELARVHNETYLEYFRNLGEGRLDPETAVHPGTFDLAALAAGAVLHGTRAAVRDGRPSVALVRPPGHHAGPDYGGGFCYLNNVAIAAADQVAEGRRVAILDYDAHHGNGTRDMFAGSASVLYLSTHEYGIYPGTGPAATRSRRSSCPPPDTSNSWPGARPWRPAFAGTGSPWPWKADIISTRSARSSRASLAISADDRPASPFPRSSMTRAAARARSRRRSERTAPSGTYVDR